VSQIQAFQRGQAMTEFIVVVTAVLLPLFVVMPLMGKWAHSAFSADVAGRYATWERTVWFAPSTVPGDVEPQNVAVRDNDKLQKLALQRIFYSRTDGHNTISPAVTSGDDLRLDPLYSVQQGGTLFELEELVAREQHESTPDNLRFGSVNFGFGAYDVLKVVNDAFGALLKPLQWLGIANRGFGQINHTFDGYYVTGLKIPLAVDNLSGFECALVGAKGKESGGCTGAGLMGNISIDTTGGIIADGWNAQSEDHFRDRTDDFVLSTMLDGTVTNTIGEILSYEMFGLSLEPTIGGLLTDGLGWVGTKPVPAELPGCSNGLCTFK
jgi:hypothetical protein